MFQLSKNYRTKKKKLSTKQQKKNCQNYFGIKNNFIIHTRIIVIDLTLILRHKFAKEHIFLSFNTLYSIKFYTYLIHQIL